VDFLQHLFPLLTPADVAAAGPADVLQSWLPLAIMGASALMSLFKGRKGKQEKQLEAQQQADSQLLRQKGTGLQTEFDTQGDTFLNQAKGIRNQQGFAQPMNYWSALLGGDRSRLAGAVAPQRASMAENYQGARKSIQKSRLRGAQKDQAEQELNRQEVGQEAGLGQGLAPMAAQQMTGIEGQIQQIMQAYSGLGLNAKAQGANILAQMLGQSADLNANLREGYRQDRQQSSQRWGALGSALGGWAMNDLQGMIGGGKTPFGTNNKMPTPYSGRDMYGNQTGWQLPKVGLQDPIPAKYQSYTGVGFK
jgi:hypothetical protein